MKRLLFTLFLISIPLFSQTVVIQDPSNGNQAGVNASTQLKVEAHQPPATDYFVDLRKLNGISLTGANVVDGPNSAFRVNLVASSGLLNTNIQQIGGTAQSGADVVHVGHASFKITGPFAEDTVILSPRPVLIGGLLGGGNARTVDMDQPGTTGASLGLTVAGQYVESAQSIPGLNRFHLIGGHDGTSIQALLTAPGLGVLRVGIGDSMLVDNSVPNNRLATMPARANAAAPVWTESRAVPLSVDLAGRLRTDLSTWLGSTVPTVGQKAMASSVPVVLSSDQASIPVAATTTPSTTSTYIATLISQTTGASRDYLTLFNASGSGKILRIMRVQLSTAPTAAIGAGIAALTGSVVSTAGATCTTVTVQLLDSTNPAVPAQVTANNNCTTDATVTFDVFGCAVITEETTGAFNTGLCYKHEASGQQPITLREGQGLLLKNTALAPTGLISLTIEFTM